MLFFSYIRLQMYNKNTIISNLYNSNDNKNLDFYLIIIEFYN